MNQTAREIRNITISQTSSTVLAVKVSFKQSSMKETDSRSYLNFDSAHPNYTFSGTVYSQSLRLRQIINERIRRVFQRVLNSQRDISRILFRDTFLWLTSEFRCCQQHLIFMVTFHYCQDFFLRFHQKFLTKFSSFCTRSFFRKHENQILLRIW